jgi:hypothetical protein
MVVNEPSETTNLDIYGSAPLEWRRVHQALEDAPSGPELTFFLGTIGADGRPHAAGVGAMYVDGDMFVVSGRKTRKSRNMEANPAVTISAHLQGVDVVLEGEASRVTDTDTVARLAKIYHDGGWPAEAAGDALTAPYSAPSAGPPPWHLYRVQIKTAFAVASAEPHGATRWRFT